MRLRWVGILLLPVLLGSACFGGGGGGNGDGDDDDGNGGSNGNGNGNGGASTPVPNSQAFENLLAPMALHLTPDGRVIVAEAGTGADDGQVSVISLDGSNVTVVMDELPSVSGTDEPWGDIGGVTGAAMAPDGVVCAAVGIPESTGQPVSGLVCSDGLTANLAAWEAENDPDGLGVASRAFDVVADGDDGWWVSDAAANTILHVDREGEILLAGVFPTYGTFSAPAEGRTTGLTFAGSSQFNASSIGPRGGIPEQGGLVVALFNGAIALVRPVDPPDPGLGLADAPAAIAAFATENRLYFLTHNGDAAGLFDADRNTYWSETGGTGFVRLDDGIFMISIAQEGRIIHVGPEPEAD